MELNLLKERDQPLLGRKRITYHCKFKGATPSRKTLRQAVASNAKSEESLTLVKHIYTKFGSCEAKIIAHIYKDDSQMKQMEPKALFARHDKEKAAGSRQMEDNATDVKPELSKQ